jgi:uncharacterized metal-binding protein YceD (DUF177 family)
MTSKGDQRSSKARGGPAADDRAPSSGAPNLSRVVGVKDIPETGLEVSMQADAAERAEIAKSAGLIAVDMLEADLAIIKLDETKLRVAGPLRARVVQTCVVSLEPFEAEIHAEVETDFAAQAQKSVPRRSGAKGRKESDDDFSSSFAAQLDAPDPIVDGRIDLGALVEEFLVLNLDPYPRKPGVRFDAAGFSSLPDEMASPFAALKKLTDEN